MCVMVTSDGAGSLVAMVSFIRLSLPSETKDVFEEPERQARAAERVPDHVAAPHRSGVGVHRPELLQRDIHGAFQRRAQAGRRTGSAARETKVAPFAGGGATALVPKILPARKAEGMYFDTRL